MKTDPDFEIISICRTTACIKAPKSKNKLGWSYFGLVLIANPVQVWLMLGIICLLLNAQRATCQQNYSNRLFREGETLRYTVKWQFIRLGTITIRTLPDSMAQGRSGHRVSFTVASDPSLAIVKIHEYNESLIDTITLMTRSFRATYRNRNRVKAIRHGYSGEDGRAYYRSWDVRSKKIFKDCEIENAQPYVDGPSLFFFTRTKSSSDTVFQVPTMINGEIKVTTLDFTGPIEEVKINSWDNPIRTRRYRGKADWKGGTSQGLSGTFLGWISDDEAAIPVRAEMKVVLGTIVLELDDWYRPGWKPPLPGRLADQLQQAKKADSLIDRREIQ